MFSNGGEERVGGGKKEGKCSYAVIHVEWYAMDS